MKRDAPVMVVLGNPPYSGISTNNGEWITRLIEDYKYVDGVHFGERKHWLGDDYVKFIRFAEHFIEKNGEGVVAYINNHSFLDNPTFRGMRWHLLQTFDDIYVIDLHGNSKKKEKAPDGSADKNVFDIQQGVSINLFVKTGKKKVGELARVQHCDVWGGREEKYDWLEKGTRKDLPFDQPQPAQPYFLFKLDENNPEEYQRGFSVEELFKVFTMGYASAQDKLTVAFNEDELIETLTQFRNLSVEQLRTTFGLQSDSRDWTVASAQADVTIFDSPEFFKPTSYRPFDERVTYYTGNSRGFYASPQVRVMQHLNRDENVAFCSCKANRDYSSTYWLARNTVSKSVISSLDNNYVFPLYLYPDGSLHSGPTRIPNLKEDIVQKIADGIGLKFQTEPEAEPVSYA